jgi:O-antigen/teichoic acid export membrane protein
MPVMSERALVPNTARRFIYNVFSLLASDVVNRGTTFLLYLLIARYLGAYEFGQLSLAITLFHTFRVIAIVGFRTVITRTITANRELTPQYLVNGSVLAVISSSLSTALLVGFVYLMGYSASTTAVIILLSLALLPYSLTVVCEAVFQAWEQMHYIAYANAPTNILKVGAALVLLQQGYGLYSVVLVILASMIAVTCIEWGLMVWRITLPRARIDLRFSWALARSSAAFLGINSVLAIRSSLNIVLLSRLLTETEVGLYNAAVQFVVPMMLIHESIGLGIFPTLCRSFGSGVEALKQVTENTVEILLVIAIPLAVGLFFLADTGLSLLYSKSDFLQAVDVLRIIVWIMIARSFTQIMGRALWAAHQETASLQISTIDTLICLITGLILIDQFGLLGAGINLLFSEMVDVVLHYIPISRRLFKMSMGGLIWKPLVASCLMAAYLMLIGQQDVFLTVFSAGALYLGVLLVIAVWSAGGTHHLKARYLEMWSK